MMKTDYSRLIDAAQGKIPADLVIKNVTMLFVTTGEWVQGDVAVTDGRIAAAGPESYDGRAVVDGTGLFAVPGFIDGHVHLESCHAFPSVFEDAVLPCGTTTAVCDPHELANVCGSDGIRFLLECADCMTLDLIVQLSSCVPSCPLETSGAKLDAEDLLKLKQLPHAGGLAEMMNVPGILQKDPAVLAKIAAFEGLPIDGHAPFLSGKELNAYCSCGISSDHECSTLQEAKDRIRRGTSVLIREGSAAKNLAALAPVITPETVDHVALCTDDRSIADLLRCGSINDLIRKLIARGIAPELAYRAASLSAAHCFRLHDRGLLAPGKLADVVLLDDVETCRIHAVFKRGRNVAGTKRETKFPSVSFALNSMKRAPLQASDLQIFSKHPETPVIGIIPGDLTTRRLEMRLPLDASGEKRPLPDLDVAKICVIARHGVNDNIGKGFLCGLGLKCGAIASSVGHDSHNLCVAGTNDEDMVLAVNALIRSGGGFAVVRNRRLLAVSDFPVAGLMSTKCGPELAEELERVQRASEMLGCRLPDSFMQLTFLTLPVIPHLKITDKGVYDTDRTSFVEI